MAPREIRLMCGIYGVAGTMPTERVLDAMRDRLHHRGPDDHGRHRCEFGAFGMQRLAIVDIAGGSQPIPNETASCWVTLNGEIYRFPALRDELLAGGHRFRSRSDTETIVHAYERDGDDVVHALRGMFAFAVWDLDRRRVLFARDHLGKKPLYYAHLDDGTLVYASELKAVLAHPGVRRELDPRAVWHYFTFKSVPAPLTIFRDVRQVPPGHRMVWDATTRTLEVTPYWRPRFTGTFGGSEDDAADALLPLLREAVRVRLEASDVPVATFLSGGVDSSVVVALTAELGRRPLSFAMGYAQHVGHKNDLAFAAEVAQRFGTDHRTAQLAVDDVVGALPAIVRSFDEPFGGTISPYWLSAEIARHAKVALSGDGADELFGSYAHHRMAGEIAAGTPAGERYAGVPEAQWRTHYSAFTDAEKRALLSEPAGSDDSATWLAAFYDDAAPGDPVNRVLEVDCRTLLPDLVLTYADRLSMAHGLEVRSPFLDLAVVEFAGTLPGSMKVRPGATKSVLKRLARRLLPAGVVDRPKEGFVLPIDAWLRGPLQPLARELTSPAALAHGIFRPDAVRELTADTAPDTAATYRIWTLLMFQLWYRSYVDNVEYPAVLDAPHLEYA